MQAKVANLFRVLGSNEIEVEKARHEIVEAAGNQLDKAYYMIEKDEDGNITVPNVARFLEENEVKAEDNEILAVIDQYDLSGKDGLSFDDFTRAIKPQDWNQTKFNERINYKEQTLKLALVKFFVKELELLRNINAQKAFIESKYWTSFDTYKGLDPRGNGSITYEDFDFFLQRNGVVLPHIDVRAAFRRVDKNGNGSVTYKELSETLFCETHIEQISEGCCPGSFKLKTPSKRVSSPSKRASSPGLGESAKLEKNAFESSPGLEKNSMASTFQSNHKSPGETAYKEPINRNLLSTQRIQGPHLYDVQPYSTPSFRHSTRPFISSYYQAGRINPTSSSTIRVTSPVRYHTVSYVRPVQRVEYYTPSQYVTETTLEKPVSAYPAPKYQSGFLKNRYFNTQLKTHFPIARYPKYRPASYKYQTAVQRPVYFARDNTERAYDYYAPRSYSPEPEVVEKIVTDAPFGRLTTRVSVSPGRRRLEVSSSPSRVRVQTVTRLYNPVVVPTMESSVTRLYDPVVTRIYDPVVVPALESFY